MKTVYPWTANGYTPDVKCVVESQARRCLFACRWKTPASLKEGLPRGLPADAMVELYDALLEMLYGNLCRVEGREWSAVRVPMPFQRAILWALSWALRLGRPVDMPPWIIFYRRGWLNIPWSHWMLLYGRRLMCPAILHAAWWQIDKLQPGESVSVQCPDLQTRVVMRFYREK